MNLSHGHGARAAWIAALIGAGLAAAHPTARAQCGEPAAGAPGQVAEALRRAPSARIGTIERLAAEAAGVDGRLAPPRAAREFGMSGASEAVGAATGKGGPDRPGSLGFLFDRRVPTGMSPISVAAGHIDRDRRLDLVTANYEADSIGVMLQLADGAFARRDVWAPGGPAYVALGDATGDGLDEVAVVLYGTSELALMLPDGAGGLVPEGRYAVGPAPTSAVFVDADGDGDLDLACTNAEDNTVTLLRNTRREGDGAGRLFVPWSVHVVGLGPQHVVAGDFTGDGVIDLATADGGCNTVSVLPGLGDGGFAPRIQSHTPWPPFSLAASDFDDDGDLDLAAASDGAFFVLSNAGDDHFVSGPVVLLEYGYGMSLAAADLDRDRDDDLAICNFRGSDSQWAPNCVAVYVNRDGRLEQGPYYLVGSSPMQVIACDVDADGHEDLVTANHGVFGEPYPPGYLSSVSVLENRGDGRLAAMATSYEFRWGYGTGLVALERQGSSARHASDLLVTLFDGHRLLRNLGRGRFAAESLAVPGRAQLVLDLDADGVTDLITRHADGSRSAWLGDRGGGFRWTDDLPPAGGFYAADLDGDRLPELLIVGDPVNVLDNLGKGRFGEPRTVPISGLRARTISQVRTAADVDGDGRAELLFFGGGWDEPDSLFVLALRPGGGFERVAGVAATFDGAVDYWMFSQGIRVQPNRRDGGVDITMLQQCSGCSATLLSLIHRSVDGHYELRDVQQSVGDETMVLLFEDLDADGRAEVVTASGDLDWYGNVRILRIDDSGRFAREPVIVMDRSVAGLAIADFDADGAPDLAVAGLRGNGITLITNADVRGRKPASETAASEPPRSRRMARPAAVALAADGATPTRITFSMQAPGEARLALYDVGGRRVLSRDLGRLGAGEHSIELPEASVLKSGVYWLRAGERGSGSVRKVVVMGRGGGR